MPPFDATFDSTVTTRSQACAARPAQPGWFGPSETPLFGWFHPAGGVPRDAVVVLCNPFGYDVGTVHHAYKKLAERLAAEGIASLRFDYLGTGDSAGDDVGPPGGRAVAAWLASIDAAVSEARKRSGARRVILFGARLGALLATVYAQEHPVDGLVLLGPPRNGSTFVRELLVFNKMRTAHPGEGASPDIAFSDDENLGFALSPELRADLASLDPTSRDATPAQRALVIARDDIPGPEVRLVEHLRARGVAVEHSHARGYADIFDFRELPRETVDQMVAWLDAPPCFGTAADRSPSLEAVVDGVTEEALSFNGLFGIVTHPPKGRVPRDRAILLLGTGANQHVGVNRMHVTFARTWAKLGFRVLRFDLSGIGESPARPGNPERQFYTTQAVPETRAAIDAMIARGAKDVILVGLCSGGYTAFHTAVRDTRVAAIAAVNVPGFQYNPVDALALAANRPGLRSRVRSVLSPKRALSDHPDDVARGFGTLVARGCRTLVVYGSGDSGLPVFEGHLGYEKARAPAHLEVQVVGACDHTFTPRAAQRRLQTLVTQHVDGGRH